MPLISAASRLMALSNASGPSRMPNSDLAAIGHFAERGGIEGGGHLRVDSFDSGEDGDFWLSDAERNREVDGVLADVRPCPRARGRY